MIVTKEPLVQLAIEGDFILCLSRFAAWEMGCVAQRMGFGEEKHKQFFPCETFAGTTIITPEDFIDLLATLRDEGV